MEIGYSKHTNEGLFKDLENENFSNLQDIQNYIPIYKEFFDLSQKNYKNVNFDSTFILKNIKEKMNYNKYLIEVENILTNEKKEKHCYCKFAPLIDPIKYMMGKYKDIDENEFYKLPYIDKKKDNVLEKYDLIHNVAYVDALFSYLSSKTKDSGFIHANNYYGMFLANQNNFKINVEDDLEYMFQSHFFHNNKHSLFEIENNNSLFSNRSFKYKKPIEINNKPVELEVEEFPNDIIDTIFQKVTNDISSQIVNINQDLSASMVNDMIYENIEHTNKVKNGDIEDDNSSTCSSSSSVTNNTDVNDEMSLENDDEINESDSESECSSESSDEENESFAIIKKYPVLAIFTECCEDTLDNYMMDNEISNNEWKSILFQIIVILHYYQKEFLFTHNDLHSSNIVFEYTKETHLYYEINNKKYKVPTHGRIFKIIDFGRSIFTINGKRFCSDSFGKGEDADTQYNTEPFFNEAKPRIEPNYSFDLCRFGCSMYDFFIEQVEDEDDICKENPIANLIRNWCLDDNGKNILYKKSGEERYPEFKLYKMIARNVHNHVPLKQLEKGIFKKFLTKEKFKSNKVMKM
jgi:hypothetical protein